MVKFQFCLMHREVGSFFCELKLDTYSVLEAAENDGKDLDVPANVGSW